MTELDFKKYKYAEPTMKPNKMLIPVNNFGFNEAGIAEFNEVYQYCLSEEAKGEMSKFIMTKSGGISIKIGAIRGARWNIIVKKTFIELIIRNHDACYYRFIIGYGKDKKDGLSGRQAFWKYKEMLEKHNINLEELAIENGEEVKKTIPSPKIDLVVCEDRTYYDAHHIDLNSAYNAGMMEAFPVLEPAIREMYNKRKENEIYKQVLNMTQGFMQSELCGFRFAHISKAGYDYTLRRLDELTKKLVAADCRILAYNTDGIWYQGDIYHDSEEGTDIGQWKHDYLNCQIRFKSKGCYEILTADGTYKPVFRGESAYEKLVPKEQWVWGDIYKGDVVEYKFKTGVGILAC